MTTKSKTRLIIAAVITLVLVPTVLYFFTWRPADADYDQVGNDLATIKSHINTFSQTFSTDSPPFFSDSKKLEEFQEAVTSYQTTVTRLDNSPVFQRGAGPKAEYGKYKDNLVAYGNAVKNTSEATRVYYLILENCGFVRFDTPVSFSTTEKSNCSKAFDSIQSLPESGFKTQFLKSYATNIEKMVGVVGSKSTDKATQLREGRMDIERLYRSVVIDYGLPSAPKEQVDKLLSIVQRDKSTLFR